MSRRYPRQAHHVNSCRSVCTNARLHFDFIFIISNVVGLILPLQVFPLVHLCSIFSAVSERPCFRSQRTTSYPETVCPFCQLHLCSHPFVQQRNTFCVLWPSYLPIVGSYPIHTITFPTVTNSFTHHIDHIDHIARLQDTF